MNKILKDMMAPPWLGKILPRPEVPITEETIRPFINMYWDFFGIDHGDQGKEALITFLLELGKERKEYNLKTLEPITWAFINGFDSGYEVGYQKAWQAWEELREENNLIIEKNKLLVQSTMAECNRIIKETESIYEKVKGQGIK